MSSPRRRGAYAVLAVGSALAGSVLAGCGSSSQPPVILNTERVERAIEQSVLAQRHIHGTASCPSGVVQRQGLSFPCVVVYHGGKATFTVTQLDGKGDVHYQVG